MERFKFDNLTRTKIWLSSIFVGVSVIAITFYRYYIGMVLIMIICGISVAPLFKISHKVSYSTKKSRDEIEDDFLGENSIIVNMNSNKGLKLKSHANGDFKFEVYPTILHKWLHKTKELSFTIEKTSEGYKTVLKDLDNNKSVITSSIEDLGNKNQINEIKEFKSRQGLLLPCLILLQKEYVEKVMNENRYNLENYDISLRT